MHHETSLLPKNHCHMTRKIVICANRSYLKLFILRHLQSMIASLFNLFSSHAIITNYSLTYQFLNPTGLSPWSPAVRSQQAKNQRSSGSIVALTTTFVLQPFLEHSKVIVRPIMSKKLFLTINIDIFC